jgi:hypothetical protein
MWKCQVCKKVNVPDSGFKAFISYTLVSTFEINKERYPMFGGMRVQIRICPKCLKKKSVEIELN